MGLIGKAKKTTKKTTKSAKKTTTKAAVAASDAAKKAAVFAKKEIKCLTSIQKVVSDVEGLDPRTWIKSCAVSTVLKGKGFDEFEACILAKVKKEVKVVKNPEAYVKGLMKQVQKGCTI